jgi:hypothetical protein
MRTLGGGAGFAGDRVEPAVELAGVVDAVVLECLAERTIVAGLRARASGVGDAWDARLRRRLSPLLPVAADAGCRVISNLGGADPAGAADAAAALGRELGLRGLRVAAVLGDDVMAQLDRVDWDGAPAGGEWLGAHAYLGSDGIAAAIDGEADVVVCGRAADSALFLGALHGALDDDGDARAGGLAVGHLLECAGQLTGGNHQAPGGRRLGPRELADLGYPLARVRPDGSAELAVAPGHPGVLDRFTCTQQLLYEVHDPAAYVTPDGVVDFSGVTFSPRDDGSVVVEGARMGSRPERLKVSGFVALPGHIVDAEIGFAGDGALDRARDAAEVLRIRLGAAGLDAVQIDLVGVDSLLGPASSPLLAAPPEVRVHASVACPDADVGTLVDDEVMQLTIAGPPNGGGIRVERRPHIAVVDGRIDRALVREEIAWMG